MRATRHTFIAAVLILATSLIKAAIPIEHAHVNKMSDTNEVNDESSTISNLKTGLEFDEVGDVDEERYTETILFEDPDLLNNKMINQQEFRFLSNNKKRCSNDVFVLALIKSSPQNFLQRREIRDTWASVTEYKGHKLAYVFTMGKMTCGNDTDCNNQLIEEFLKHADIVQGDFVEHFKNQTYKTIMGLTWTKTFCGHAKYILNTNDDTMIDMFHLVDFLETKSKDGKADNFMYCSTFFDKGPSRNPNEKTYTTIDEYPYDKFPPHCEGFANLMSQDVAVKILDAAKSVAFLWLDDVFTTGFLPLKAGVKHFDMEDDHSYIFMQKSQIATELKNAMFIVANHRQLRQNWESAWNKIKSQKR